MINSSFMWRYKVTYKIDSLNTNPAVEYFDDEKEMFDYIKDLEVTEYSSIRIDEL